MTQFITPQMQYALNINGQYHNTLDIEGFSQMMKDPSYCYKFYWLEAIVNIISEGIQEITFDSLIDELWNLISMESSLNSSKSNKLPKWDPFFIIFAENQYGMYNLIHEKEEFYNILQKNMQPVYDSARRQGYEIWNY